MINWRNMAENFVAREVRDIRFAAERVHGNDDRKQVLDTTRYPASAIAHLLVTTSDGQEFGATGTFIHPRVLLTAGHALHIPGGGSASGPVQRVVVAPGRNGASLPFGADAAQNIWVHPHWRAHVLRDFDCGLVLVPALPSVGTFGIAALDDHELQGLEVLISGYPDDQSAGTQWRDLRTIAAVSPGQVAYDIDTEVGQSGSAVFSWKDQRATAVAIHQFGDEYVNYGTRITRSLLVEIANQMATWGV